jgi:4-hydroxy-tetrahydrodipicolinate synthase
VAHADDIPVIVSIGALRLDDILRLADDAQSAGVSGVLLAPVSYQRLTEDEVFRCMTVTRQLSVPLCIYDNPATTGFSFSDELLFAAAALPNIGSISLAACRRTCRRYALVFLIPSRWASPVTGERPPPCRPGLTSGTRWSAGCFRKQRWRLPVRKSAQSERLEPLWALFRHYGSLRVVAAAAEMLGKVDTCAPFPFRLQGEPREALAAILRIWLA